MPLTNPEKLVTEERLSEFYQQLLPYLGGMPEALANKFDKSDLYSTDEKIVGCWTDGKPLYQKVISSTTPNSDNVKYISVGTGISVDTYVSIAAMMYDGAGAIPFSGINVLLSSFGSTLTGIRVTAFNNDVAENPNTILIKTNAAGWRNKQVIIIVKYTKSTDTANSFNYGSETDYSTDEKIIGTWIDGKPLYQKTVSCGALPNTSYTTTAHGVANIDSIVDIIGVAIRTSDHISLTLPYASVVSAQDSVAINASRSNIRIDAGNDKHSFNNSYVTIRYTKTS